MPALPDRIRLQHHGSAARARAVLWLALLALALRALVPAGYMPDARALHDGRLEVTFCSAAGDMPPFALALPASGKDKAGHDTAGSGAQCPFGLLAHATPAPASAPAPLVLAAGRHMPPKPALGVPPSRGAQGPPLGSRAPPALA
ncbi:MAG: DUF2946 family protein [Achromobacter sp.]|uniref:DUF2946 family protein n=1 Tax=Achromobacter sp. TaxID=134375 RepID=UPI00258E90B7|nr:DUF2946 family protein [Achromobacter sp.]MCW0205781.1 DUF2946 family protein [Achromobacter sp.]